MRRFIIAACLAVTAAEARAAKPPMAYHEYKADEEVSIDPTKAYLLVRTLDIQGFRFARVDGDDGSKLDSANLPELLGFMTIDKTLPVKVHLLAVSPGTYWLYGVKTSAYLDGPYLNCLCMGTIRFDAKAGQVTDLGTIRDLAYETRNGHRPDVRGQRSVLLNNRELRAITVEPVTAADPVPSIIAVYSRVSANYRAAGWLPNIEGTRIDRISAIPGIVAYDRDVVIDVKTGQRFR